MASFGLSLGKLFGLNSTSTTRETEERKLGEFLKSLCSKEANRLGVAIDVPSGGGVIYRVSNASLRDSFPFLRASIPFDGETVVKKVAYDPKSPPDFDYMTREWGLHREMERHENVVQLYHVASCDDCTYLLLEMCAASLCRLYLTNGNEYTGPRLSDLHMLYDIAKGLAHMHGKDLVHRDIKPPNILISLEEPVRLKLADFGSIKPTNPATGSCSWSGPFGSEEYRSPELIDWFLEAERSRQEGKKPPPRNRISNKTDVFSAGLVFFYILTKGKHPFGGGKILTSNVHKGKVVKDFDDLLGEYDPAFRDLIRKMIQKVPSDRPTMKDVELQLGQLIAATQQQ